MVSSAEIEKLYRQYGPALYRRAMSLLSREAEAHEIVQETFLQFWKARTKFRRESSPFTFLYRITTNLSIDRLRRRTTAGTHMSYEDHHEHGGGAGPDARIAAASELAMLTQGLDDEVVAIAVMSLVDGLTQEQIAEALGLSRRTIVKRLKKFRKVTGANQAGSSGGGS
jgi:RNA polymerase sigma-70 factor (ECF subfamily)